MSMYHRSDPDSARLVGEWDDAVSWIAHPDEGGVRASHAIRTADGVWVIDPLDAPNVEEFVDPLGEVVGVAVLTCWHARDADAFAERYDVPVHVPEWMSRIGDLVDAPIERYGLAPGEPDADFRTLPCRPFPRWEEVFLYHEASGTLVTPDSLGTADMALIDDERLGLPVLRRLQPPVQLRGLDPDRILVGHGEPLTENAGDALTTALDGARRSFPTALLEHGPESVRSLVDVLR